MPDWSRLPEELLHIISENVDNCFDVVHARSVCTTWRSTFLFPACLLRTSYSLPLLADLLLESKDFCTIEKIPLFMFRVHQTPPPASPSEYFLGGIRRDDSEDHTDLPSPLQCSVKVKLPGTDPALMNMLDCKILPLGHEYRIIDRDYVKWTRKYGGVVVLPLNKDRGGGEFVVLLKYLKTLLALRSGEMKWIRVKNVPDAPCSGLVTFRGRFYATFRAKEIFDIDPYSLEATPLMTEEHVNSCNYLVPSGDDELFLVEKIIPRTGGLDFSQLTLRVCRLDVEAGRWVVVSDLGNRLLVIGCLGNVSCSSDGFGVSRNLILFTSHPGNVTSINLEYTQDDMEYIRDVSTVFGSIRVRIV